MSSPKRIAANRRNAQKSTGPRTAAGKIKSCMNALKHGLDAQAVVLAGEDEAAFLARLEAWIADVRPRDDRERALVEQAVRLSWQLDRAERVEVERLTRRIHEAMEDAARRGDPMAAGATDLLAFDDS